MPPPRKDPNDAILERIQQLEDQNRQLEKRFSTLEAQVNDQSKILKLIYRWDEALEEDKKVAVSGDNVISNVRKLPKVAEISTDFEPAVVWTGVRDPAEDKEKYKHDGSRGGNVLAEDYKKRLVAPAAGFISAALEISLVWPSEYAKVQLQLNRANPNFQIIAHMKTQGLSIYKSLTPMLIGAPLQGMLRFGSLDYFNNLLRDPATGRVGRASGLIAGVSAGVMESIIVVTPMETVKTRLVESGKGLTDGIKYVVAKDGVNGLYKGLGATMMKSSSNQALRFLIFNEYKTFIIGSRPVHELSGLESLFGGMFAGCLGAVGNTPFDTVKTRMQGSEAKRYKGILDCAKAMVTTEGFFSLWKGLSARLMRVVPGQGIIFCSYESIFNAINKRIA